MTDGIKNTGRITQPVIIKEGDLTVIKDLTSEYPSALEVLTAAYDAIARIFPRQSVIDAHDKIDPDSL